MSAVIKSGKWGANGLELLRIILGALFVYASLDKIFEPAEFANVIYNYRILPVELINCCALLVPWLELLLGVCLLLGIWLETVSLMLAALTMVFIILLATALFRGLNIECGCFTLSNGGDRVSWKRIAEDVIILAGLLLVFCKNFTAIKHKEK